MLPCPFNCTAGIVGHNYPCIICNGTGKVPAGAAERVADGAAYREDLRRRHVPLCTEAMRLHVSMRTLLRVLYGVDPRSVLVERKGEAFIETGRALANRQVAPPAPAPAPAKRAKPSRGINRHDTTSGGTSRRKKTDDSTLW
jgi:hypothetical protein